jgi:hypothetical protein
MAAYYTGFCRMSTVKLQKRKDSAGANFVTHRIDKAPRREYLMDKSKGALSDSCGFRKAPLLFFRFISEEWS